MNKFQSMSVAEIKKAATATSLSEMDKLCNQSKAPVKKSLDTSILVHDHIAHVLKPDVQEIMKAQNLNEGEALFEALNLSREKHPEYPNLELLFLETGPETTFEDYFAWKVEVKEEQVGAE